MHRRFFIGEKDSSMAQNSYFIGIVLVKTLFGTFIFKSVSALKKK